MKLSVVVSGDSTEDIDKSEKRQIMCQKPKKKREDMQGNTGLLLLCQEIYVGIQNEGSGNENEKSGGREGGREKGEEKIMNKKKGVQY